MKVISTEKIPIKMWLKEIEESAMSQIKNLANLPFAFKHIAIMPDCHAGYGMPIGGVLATKGVIIPNAVGVDIGCGMCAVKTTLNELNEEDLKDIINEIKWKVPVGFNKHKEKQKEKFEETVFLTDDVPDFCDSVVRREYNNAMYSIGTLGGGNHFIEIQKGSDGHIWIMVHSGSRNLGKQVADHYNKLAVSLNKTWHSSVDPKQELSFLPLNSSEGQAYIKEMNYCIEFALANRSLIMGNIIGIISKQFPEREIVAEPMINIAHNYAKMENHFGENVMVHRKGATLATKNTIGIIPGSQGTKSYIVKGLGNPDSFNSCSHGAGRRMGRGQAQKELNLENEINKLNKLGVMHAINSTKDLDEAPGAYKDIDEVMQHQKDLVEILVELTPLGVIKG